MGICGGCVRGLAMSTRAHLRCPMCRLSLESRYTGPRREFDHLEGYSSEEPREMSEAAEGSMRLGLEARPAGWEEAAV